MIATAYRAIPIVLLAAAPARAADGITAIETAGFGTLTMCVDWMPFHGCRVYDHVTLPAQVRVGDTVPLEYGDDPGHYDFRIARIIKNGVRCTVTNDAGADGERGDSIKIPSCVDVSKTH